MLFFRTALDVSEVDGTDPSQQPVAFQPEHSLTMVWASTSNRSLCAAHLELKDFLDGKAAKVKHLK